MKNPYLKKPLKPIEVKRKNISQLLHEMSQTGFQGRKLGEAAKVWEQMLREKNLLIVLGLAGSMSTAGMWKIICWLAEKRFFDVLVSTGANISEDILEAVGGKYWQGSPQVNDEDLLHKDVDRFYDVFASELDYRKMEDCIAEFVKSLDKNILSSREFLYEFGKWLLRRKIDCIVSTCAKKKIPIYSPALVDSAYGEAILLAKKKLVIDQVKDFEEFVRIGERVKDVGVVYVGGGVPKDFTQLMAVSLGLIHPDGLSERKAQIQHGVEAVYPHKYAIQITTDSPQWGGLSGCTLEEAISWGKVSSKGKFVTCYCDATIALPLLVHALNEKNLRRKSFPDLSSIFK